jgi:hypothetical protein
MQNIEVLKNGWFLGQSGNKEKVNQEQRVST